MNIGIIGANGQVGTELCVLFREAFEQRAIPIVRNEPGAHFLRHQSFPLRIADISNSEEARRALKNIDVIVVAAFAWQFSREGFQSRGARKTNEKLVRNAVRYSDEEASIIYFSSQAAFGDDLGAPGYNDWSLYTREKRNAEAVFEQACEKEDRTGYIFRLGFVHGPHQGSWKKFDSELSSYTTVNVVADPTKSSNVLHTVTLADAIRVCGKEQPKPGTYSLVNEPAWTWEEVINFYSSSNTDINYHPPTESQGVASSISNLMNNAWQAIEARQGTLRTFTLLLPDRVTGRLFTEYLKRQRGTEIEELQLENWFKDGGFLYNPIPGPFLPGLKDTKPLLRKYDKLDGIF